MTAGRLPVEPDRKEQGPEEAREDELRLPKYAFYGVFASGFVMVFAAGISNGLGREDLAHHFFGPTAIALLGLTFCLAMAINYRYYGYADMIFIGRISKTSHKGIYFALVGAILLIGLGLMVLGTFLMLNFSGPRVTPGAVPAERRPAVSGVCPCRRVR